MAYSYPIWNVVQACIYKGNKSYGARDVSQVTVRVGTSASNSEKLITHTTTRNIEGDYVVFTFGVTYPDGTNQVLVRKWMHSKSREWFDEEPGELAA